MKLTYWYCEHLTDADCYAVREPTLRQAKRVAAEYYAPGDLAAPVKVIIEYRNAFDLLEQCTGEGGLYQEACAAAESQ